DARHPPRASRGGGRKEQSRPWKNAFAEVIRRFNGEELQSPEAPASLDKLCGRSMSRHRRGSNFAMIPEVIRGRPWWECVHAAKCDCRETAGKPGAARGETEQRQERPRPRGSRTSSAERLGY